MGPCGSSPLMFGGSLWKYQDILTLRCLVKVFLNRPMLSLPVSTIALFPPGLVALVLKIFVTYLACYSLKFSQFEMILLQSKAAASGLLV